LRHPTRASEGRSKRTIHPRFSVIIPTHNQAELLGRAAKTVLGQSFEDFELIIVDDGSTDDTDRVIRSLQDPRLRSARQKRAGPAAARNAGARRAAGQFLTFLDSDDEALPGWLEGMDVELKRGAAVARCGIERVAPDGLVREVVLPAEPKDTARWVSQFLAGTYAIERGLFLALGGFEESLTFGEQTELAIRIWRRCTEGSLSVELCRQVLIRNHWRGPDERYGDARRRAAEYFLSRHADVFKKSRTGRATLLGLLGVLEAKAGDLRQARRHLWRAWLARPWDSKSAVRLGAVIIPPMGRLLWGRQLDDITETIPNRDLAPKPAKDVSR
jgi:glycosyltransferase involved in cell wall biosynthesis